MTGEETTGTTTRAAAGRASRRAVLGAAVAAAAPLAAGPGGRRRAAAQGTPVAAGADDDRAAAILALARASFAEEQLQALLVRVVENGQEVATLALGEAMSGVPATPAMRVRNGAVAFSYLALLLLRYVDQGRCGLDDPVGRWLPDLPHADAVTLRMLASMTSGYPDYVPDADFDTEIYANPFRQWRPEELIAIGLRQGQRFDPGTAFEYSHTNFVILGRALEAIGIGPLGTLMRREVLDPLGLRDTVDSDTPAIPEPVLHVLSGERKQALGVPAATRFVEESTYWNPSWTTAQGAVQVTTIADMTATAIAVGEGTLLTPESHAAMTTPLPAGFGRKIDGCAACFAVGEVFNYGLGLVLKGPWQLQNPAFAACEGIEAYLPSRRLALGVVATYRQEVWDAGGTNTRGRANERVYSALSALLAPESPLAGPK